MFGRRAVSQRVNDSAAVTVALRRAQEQGAAQLGEGEDGRGECGRYRRGPGARRAVQKGRRLVARWRVAHVCDWKVVEAVVNAAGVDQGLREVVVKIDLGGPGEEAV